MSEPGQTYYNVNTTATSSTNLPAWQMKETRAMIETPAFIQIDLLNNTRISGRFVRYSDPTRADAYGAFIAEDREGETQYVLWAAILRVSVFRLTSDAPEVPVPEPIKPEGA